jgi:hypothetical protein
VDDSTQPPLAELLPGALPAGIAALPPDAQRELAGVLAQARTAQRRELKEAADSLLELVPGFLRGAVKRAAGL